MTELSNKAFHPNSVGSSLAGEGLMTDASPMTSTRKVLIQPSGAVGNREAEEHWESTINTPVDYTKPDVARFLTTDQQHRLIARYPDRPVETWGLKAVHDSKFAKLQLGDLVVFTGGNRAHHVGVIGVSFTNPGLAESLWTNHDGSAPWQNIYTIDSIAPIDLTYDELREAIGDGKRHLFQGANVFTGQIASHIAGYLEIADRETEAEPSPNAAVTTMSARSNIAAPAAANEGRTESTTATRRALTNTVTYEEQLLVRDYRKYLQEKDIHSDTRVLEGGRRCDVTYASDGGTALIEAKGDVDIRSLYTARGQLETYGAHIKDLASVSVLLPKPPTKQYLIELHVAGIGVIHRSGETFQHHAPNSIAHTQLLATILDTGRRLRQTSTPESNPTPTTP